MHERMRFKNWKNNKTRLGKLRTKVAAKKLLTAIIAHVRATWSIPTQAAVSTTFFLDKKKSVKGTKGLRIIHTFCPFWRCFLRGLVLKGSQFLPPSWAHGGIKGRRREGLMLIARVGAYKLRKARRPHAIKSYDATSAFHSGDLDDLHEVERKRL